MNDLIYCRNRSPKTWKNSCTKNLENRLYIFSISAFLKQIFSLCFGNCPNQCSAKLQRPSIYSAKRWEYFWFSFSNFQSRSLSNFLGLGFSFQWNTKFLQNLIVLLMVRKNLSRSNSQKTVVKKQQISENVTFISKTKNVSKKMSEKFKSVSFRFPNISDYVILSDKPFLSLCFP